MKMLFGLASALVVLLFSGPVIAGDAEDLESLLAEFLATSDQREAHVRFWSDDLIYTSSGGTRFGKDAILESFDNESEDANDAPPAVVYSGDQVTIRIYGDMAVVAFRLVGTPTDKDHSADVMYYFNTGTFQKRGGIWKAVAWQATIIPPA